jgi:hypothetical protein
MPEGVKGMENPFRRAFELQRRSSLKCPSCPTICQQNVKTSIQVTGIYAECEKPQTKIKKTMSQFSAGKFMLLAMLQHKYLHISQQSVINFYSEWVNFLAEW